MDMTFELVTPIYVEACVFGGSRFYVVDYRTQLYFAIQVPPWDHGSRSCDVCYATSLQSSTHVQNAESDAPFQAIVYSADPKSRHPIIKKKH